MKYYTALAGFVGIAVLASVSTVSAHVVVKPAQVGVGSFQMFTIGVPVEKDMPTIALRLVVPPGLEYVTPNAKPGWTITKTATEIIWAKGSIPAGQRDDFMFSAKVPSSEAKLQWKAYQTYSDGTIVAWDSSSTSRPASETKVVNDLAAQVSTLTKVSSSNSTATTFSIVALVFSIIALVRSKRSTAN
jgi:uncharacterized protein YcnI